MMREKKVFKQFLAKKKQTGSNLPKILNFSKRILEHNTLSFVEQLELNKLKTVINAPGRCFG